MVFDSKSDWFVSILWAFVLCSFIAPSLQCCVNRFLRVFRVWPMYVGKQLLSRPPSLIKESKIRSRTQRNVFDLTSSGNIRSGLRYSLTDPKQKMELAAPSRVTRLHPLWDFHLKHLFSLRNSCPSRKPSYSAWTRKTGGLWFVPIRRVPLPPFNTWTLNTQLSKIFKTWWLSWKNQQKTLKLCWVPSHTGIQGNERADEGARSAIDSNEIENIALPYKDFYPIIKEKVREKWKDEWRRVQENKLREIKDVVCEWPSSHCRERRAEVTLCRLRIGHTLTTHRHLMERTPPPVCIHCNQPRTVKHLLVECQNNMAQRVQFYGSQTITLRDVLGEGRSFNHRKLMLYLNAIGVRDIWEVWASDYIVMFSCFPWSNTTVDLWYGVPGS